MRERLTRRPKHVELPKQFDFPTTTIIQQAEFLSHGGKPIEIFHATNTPERTRVRGGYRKVTLFAEPDDCNRFVTSVTLLDRQEAKKPIPWAEVPARAVKGFLKKIANDNDVTPTTLDRIQIKRGSRQLYDYAMHVAHTVNLDPTTFLLEEAGFTLTVNDYIERFKQDKIKDWEKVPPEAIKAIILGAEIPTEVPATMYARNEFYTLSEKYGKTLSGLYYYAVDHEDRGEMDPVSFLYQKIGLTPTADDVIDFINLDLPNRPVSWPRLSSEALADLLLRVGGEKGKPAFTLAFRDFGKLKMLGGRTLRGLYDYARTLPERGNLEPIPYLLQQAGIEASIDELDELSAKKKDIPWERVSEGTVYDMLEIIAIEKRRPVTTLRYKDIENSADVLGNRAAVALLEHALEQTEFDKEDAVKMIFTKAGIDAIDIRDLLQNKEQVPWKVMPDTAVLGIIEQAADELEIPVPLLRQKDLGGSFEVFNGATLMPMLEALFPNSIKGKTKIDQLFEHFEIQLGFEDIQKAFELERRIEWPHVPPQTIQSIMVAAAKEVGKPLSELTSSDLKQPFLFLHRHNLFSMYVTFLNRLKRAGLTGKTPMQHIFDYAGIDVTSEWVHGKRRTSQENS